MLTLRRLDRAGFDALLAEWMPLFEENEELLFEHCRPHIEHAERIIDETPADPRYGIFGLVRSSDAGDNFEGFTHINHKLPGNPHAEVRMVWNTLSPRYENELSGALLAEFTVAYISGVIQLAQGEMRSKSVRMYLGNATDKRYAQGIVAHMQRVRSDKPPIALAGNWLHISDVTGLAL